MSNIIIIIAIYIVWTIIKNVFKEMNTPGSVTGQMPTPPVVNVPRRMTQVPEYKPAPRPQPAQPVRTQQVSGSLPYENVVYDSQSTKKQASKVQKTANVIQPEEKNISTMTKKEQINPLVFDQNSVVNGIIMSEVLGKPRARKNMF